MIDMQTVEAGVKLFILLLAAYCVLWAVAVSDAVPKDIYEPIEDREAEREENFKRIKASSPASGGLDDPAPPA